MKRKQNLRQVGVSLTVSLHFSLLLIVSENNWKPHIFQKDGVSAVVFHCFLLSERDIKENRSSVKPVCFTVSR